MKNLVEQMTAEIPSDHLSMSDVVPRFELIRASLPWWILRRPIDKRVFPLFIRMIRVTPTIARTVRDMWTGKPAVPIPLPDSGLT